MLLAEGLSVRQRVTVLLAVFLVMRSGPGISCSELLSTKIPFEIKKSELGEYTREGAEPRPRVNKSTMHVYRQDDGTVKIVEKDDFLNKKYKISIQKLGFTTHAEWHDDDKLIQTFDATDLNFVERVLPGKPQEFSVSNEVSSLVDRKLTNTTTSIYKVNYISEESLVIGPCIIKTKVYDVFIHADDKKLNSYVEIRRYYSEELGIVLKYSSKANLTGAVKQASKSDFKLQNIEISFSPFPFE